jgi:signal transduction histidine kinase
MQTLGRRASSQTVLLLVCLAIATLQSISAYGADTVKIGILAFRSKAQTLRQWQPLENALKQTMPERDFVVQAMTYPELDLAVAGRQLDFVLTNPGHYIILAKRNGLSAPLATLATDLKGQRITLIGGVMFSRAEQGNINSLADIRDKSVAIVGTGSLGGYQAQAYELAQAGIPLPIGSRLKSTGMPHDNVVATVIDGGADVGFVRTGVLESMAAEGKLDMTRIKLLNRQNLPDFPVAVSTRLYPEWPFSMLPQTDEALARQVAATLFLLKDNSELTRAAGIHGFSVPADYGPVSDLLRALRLPPFETSPHFTLQDVVSRYSTAIVCVVLAIALILLLGARLLITRRKLVAEKAVVLLQQKQLQENEAQLLVTLTAIPDLLVELGLDGRCHACQSPRGGLRLASPKKMLGKLVSELLPEGAAAGVMAALRDANEQGFSHGKQIELAHAQGTLWFELSLARKARVLNDEVRFIVLARDITERKAGEVEIGRLNRDLEDRIRRRTLALEISNQSLTIAKAAAEVANRAKTIFLSTMSHELRTPMNGIMGLTGLALRRATDPKQKDHLTKAAQSSEKLLSIINDILDYTKMESEDFTLDKVDFMMESLVETVANQKAPMAKDKGLGFTTDITPDLASLLLQGDAERIGYALGHLVSNAIKFTAEGQVTVRALLAQDGQSDVLVRFEVTDTGIGISAEVQNRLFTPFEQIDGSLTRNYGGIGLGLALCKRLAEATGGRIGLESIEGKGSTFWFTAKLGKVG